MKWSTCFFLALLPLSVDAQTPDKTIRLTVSPAAAPSPALKYELLPDLRDQVAGNAALNYYRALDAAWLSHQREERFHEKMTRWMDASLNDFPRDETRWLRDYLPLREIDLAARKSHCDWELTERLRSDGLRVLLPEINGLRELCMLLVLRARLEMSEQKYDQAVYSLQTGFGVARHLSRAPHLIFGLVGQSIAGIMAREVEHLIQRPGAPNLYWALTALPTPLISLSAGMQGDRLMMVNLIPDFSRLESTVLSVEEARAVLTKLYHNQGIFGGGLPQALQGPTGVGAFFPTMMVAKNYSQAKQYLLDHGWPPAKVEAMPAPQAVLLYTGLRARAIQDDALKWCHVPYWQARPYLASTVKEIERANQDAEGSLPLLGGGPNIATFLRSTALTDRRVASLRCIEAIRLYAATNHGSLPKKLADVSEVPIPRDPVTGMELLYEVEGDKAILTSPPLDDTPSALQRYEITIRR